jgi:hypothetical protein
MRKWLQALRNAGIGAVFGVVMVAIWYFTTVYPYDTMGYGVLGAVGYSFWAIIICGFIGFLTGWPR